MMGLSSLAFSASHQVLATSFSWILATSTWFSFGTRAAFKRSVVSISHCLASSGLSPPVNIAGCSRLKSDMLPDLCSLGAATNPCQRSSVCFYWFSIILWITLRISIFSLVGPFCDCLELLQLTLLSISMLVKDDWKLESEKIDGI